MKSYFIVSKSFAQNNFVYPLLYEEYDSAVVFDHLKVISVKRTDTSEIIFLKSEHLLYTLKSAIKKEWVKIKERENYMIDNINVLIIESNSNEKIFIRSGEMLIGGR